jgi:predicted GH43/DUF377 family glycosyl hydrolase
MAQTRLAAVALGLAISLVAAAPSFACTKDDTAYFDTFSDSDCLQTPLQNTALDPLGGLRLATNGTPTSVVWDTDTDFGTGRVGVSTLATTGSGAAAGLTLPSTPLALTADPQNPVLSMTASPVEDSDNVDDPTVQKIGASYVMWYSGTAEDGRGPAIFEATSPDGQVWARANGGDPVLEGDPGTFDAHGVFAPQVIYDAGDATNPYKMYYAGIGDVFGAIGFATSADGLTWTKHSGPVLDHGQPGSADSFAALDPSVMKDGQTWKMWYTGDDSNRKRVAYATSQDGITWTKGGRVISPEDPNVSANLAEGAFSPTVWKDGSSYRMALVGRKFVSGTTYQTKLINASSSDGISWNPGSIALNQGGTSTKFDFSNLNSPYVLPDGNGFKLWYSGNSIDANGNFHTRIGLATSSNGNSWSKVNGAAAGSSVLDIGTLGTAFDSRSASGLSVTKPAAATFVGVYSGTRGSDFKPRLGEATSSDGSAWTKVPLIGGDRVGGEVLPLTDGGTFDDNGQRDPAVLYDGTTFQLYFTAISSTGTRAIGRSSVAETGSHVPDTTWSPQAQVFGPSGSGFDQSAVSHPSVIKDGATYVLYYTATDGSGNQTIGSTTSLLADLSSPTPRTQVLTAGPAGSFDAGGVKDPVVIKDGATYRMLYTGVEDRSDGTTVERVGYATSGNGTNWTKQGVLLNPSGDPFSADELGAEPTGFITDGATGVDVYTSGLDRSGRMQGLHWTGDTATAGEIPSGDATYQFGDANSSVRDFRKIIRTSTGDSPEVTLWMSFLQPYSSGSSEFWSAFFPVTVSASAEDLHFLLNIRGVRWQARLTDPSATPVLDKVQIDHAPVQFVPSASATTRNITPPSGQALTRWGDMTVRASTFAPAGGGGASASVHVLDASSGQELVGQALNLGGDTTISLFSIDAAAHPELQARFDLSSASPFSATPLITSLKVLFNAAAQPPPPPPPPPAPVLTLAASATTVNFGQSATLSGNLAQAGAALAGQAVTLQQQPAGAAAFTPVATPTTDAAGNYTASVTPSVNTVYKGTFTGVTSEPTVTVNVRPIVKLKAVRKGKSGVFTGSVAPVLAGETIQIQQLKSGAFVPFATAKTDSTSKFKVTKALKPCGKFTFKAVDPAGAVHDLGESLPAKVELHRLTLKVAAKARKATFTGKVSPLHKKGTVVISRVVGKKLSKLGKAKLSKKSTFKLVKVLKKGKYVFVAAFAADKCHFAGKSANRKLTVR